MVLTNSQDELKLTYALLCDVQTLHSLVYDQREMRLDFQKISKRTSREGLSFLTKSLPRLAKALDRALAGDVPLNATALAFTRQSSNSQLPKLFGKLFQQVFSHDGQVLPTPCVNSIHSLRNILYLWYKYDVPYSTDAEQTVLSQFLTTEEEIRSYDQELNCIADQIDDYSKTFEEYTAKHTSPKCTWTVSAEKQDCPCDSAEEPEMVLPQVPSSPVQNDESYSGLEEPRACRFSEASRPQSHRPEDEAIRRVLDHHTVRLSRAGALQNVPCHRARTVIRRARKLLNKLFLNFDPTDIVPRHGPGAVSTKEKLWGKYFWTNIPDRLANVFPIDAYFYASLGHVCDAASEIHSLGNREEFAQVILVPKDSRGPRLISAEPLVFQYIQQGLGRAIVRHTERHPFTRDDVHFTDQQPNRQAALLGSRDGRYSTLDLSEASDRVSVGLVRVLFPSKVLPYLLAARSLGTTMPDGQKITLRKYAPMGSALCFPILALTVWALLRAGLRDADSKTRHKSRRPNILVYGDDVIVETAHAENAIELLEAFGLKINRAKSCVAGFFRESCGMDAYRGIEVTPTRIRVELPSTPSPSSYCSWVAQANQFYDKKYFHTYEYIVGRLLHIYGRIPSKELQLKVPSLYEVPIGREHYGTRVNHDLQKMEYLVNDVCSVNIQHEINGWKMLLRYFTSGSLPTTLFELIDDQQREDRILSAETKDKTPLGARSFSASQYTKRDALKLRRRWR